MAWIQVLMVPDERIVLDGIPRPLDVDILQRMGRQLVVDDVLRRDAQERGLGHAEELVQMRGISGADLEGPVDIGDAVRIAVDKDIDRDLLEIGQPADEAAAGPGRDSSHADQDAVGLLPVIVLHQALEHARRFR